MIPTIKHVAGRVKNATVGLLSSMSGFMQAARSMRIGRSSRFAGSITSATDSVKILTDRLAYNASMGTSDSSYPMYYATTATSTGANSMKDTAKEEITDQEKLILRKLIPFLYAQDRRKASMKKILSNFREFSNGKKTWKDLSHETIERMFNEIPMYIAQVFSASDVRDMDQITSESRRKRDAQLFGNVHPPLKYAGGMPAYQTTASAQGNWTTITTGTSGLGNSSQQSHLQTAAEAFEKMKMEQLIKGKKMYLDEQIQQHTNRLKVKTGPDSSAPF